MSSISRIYRGTDLVYTAPEAAPLTAFLSGLQNGDRIELFRAANIRTDAVISTATLKGVNPHGTRGTIVGGPKTGISNSIWYDINFDAGFDGWCVSDNYTKIAGTTTTTGTQTTPSYFKVGDRVTLFRASNIRSSAGINQNLKGVNPSGTQGTITAGPTKNGTVNWYSINFDTGHDGWCASDNYVITPGTVPGGSTGGTGSGTGGGGGATGPTVKPPPDNAAPTVTVGTSAELLAALRNASANAIIGVRPGSYSPITATGIRKTNVTVRPTDRNNPPRWSGNAFDLSDVEGIILDGLHFRSTQKDGDGYPAGSGVKIQRYKNFAIRNCWFDGYLQQLIFSPGANGLLEWNLFTGTGMDAIRVYRKLTNLVIRNNEFRDPRVNNARAHESNRHPDCIQFAMNILGDYSDGVLIEKNRVTGRRDGDGYQQLIFGFNEIVSRQGGGAAQTHRNFTIRDNYLEGGHAHGICVGGITNVLVERNVIRRFSNFPATSIRTPQITTITTQNSGIIRNNVAPMAVGQGGVSVNSAGLSISNNIVSTTAVPTGWVMPKTGPYGYA